jgi:hypothetical protein
LLLVFAQLRDVLAAEDSTIVSQEDHDRGSVSPKRTQPELLPLAIRQRNIYQTAAEAGCHPAIVRARLCSVNFHASASILFSAIPTSALALPIG